MAVRILSSPAGGPDEHNPFVRMLVTSFGDDVQVRSFSWGRAIMGRYDVLHLHWPELLLRAHSRGVGAGKKTLFGLLLLRLRMTGTGSVWTVHNDRPHEAGDKVERWLLRLWARACTRRVFLSNAHARAQDPARDRVVPHGDYSLIFDRSMGRPVERHSRTVLLFGMLRPYKGVESLLAVAPELASHGVAVRICGKPLTDDYESSLAKAASGLPNVVLRAHELSDEELAGEILAAALVVLPYQHLYNSGAALLPLTLATPVLVGRFPAMQELQEELGERWIRMFDGETVDAAAISTALQAPDHGRHDERSPVFKNRDWPSIAAAYSAIYREIAERRSGPGVRILRWLGRA